MAFKRVVVLLWADMFANYALWIMQTYLTDVWKLSPAHAAGIQNVYSGLTKALPLFFILGVDSLTRGNFWMLAFSSTTYSVGLGLLSMSTPPVLSKSTGNCSQYQPECLGRTQKALFYTSLALIAVGVSGHIVSLVAFASEQRELKKPPNNDQKNGTQESQTKANNTEDNSQQFQPIEGMISLLKTTPKRSFRIFVVILVPVIGTIALPYVKPWSIRFGVPAICSFVALIFFISGYFEYEFDDKPRQSLFTNVVTVVIASTCKMFHKHPEDNHQLYKYDEYTGTHINGLRFLEKAAIVEEDPKKKWRLCTISQVEDTKITICMIPFWISFIISGLITSIGSTYFVEQANHLNYKVGKLKLPITILLAIYEQTKLGFSTSFTFTSIAGKRYTPALGIMFSVLCCITASKVESRRLGVISRYGLFDKPDGKIPMTAFWLVPQYFLLAGHDSIMEMSVSGFFSDKATESMKKYIVLMTKAISGLGIIASVLSVYIVGRVSERGGRTNWFQETLNKSRLDNYYWVLAVLTAANFVWYIIIATRYRTEDIKTKGEKSEET